MATAATATQSPFGAVRRIVPVSHFEFIYRTGLDVTRVSFHSAVAEWIARVYRQGKSRYRVVVEGLLDFDVDRLEVVEERTAEAILARLRKSYPTRAKPWEDPSAERVMDFEVAVAPVRAKRR
jgi:hypothetical protein